MNKVWHLVLFRTLPRVTPSEVTEIRALFTDGVGRCDGLEWVRTGANHSRSRFAEGWNEAIVMQFRDRAARDAYLVHPVHQKASTRTGQAFYSDLVVFDLDVDPTEEKP